MRLELLGWGQGNAFLPRFIVYYSIRTTENRWGGLLAVRTNLAPDLTAFILAGWQKATCRTVPPSRHHLR
jgi:hypothetical protein